MATGCVDKCVNGRNTFSLDVRAAMRHFLPPMPLFSKRASAEEAKRTHALWDNVRTIVYAVGMALIFRSLLFEPFHIPSGSMRSTLLEGDYIFVTKYSYGYSRYSFPLGARFDYFDGRMPDKMPKRGDVVVFRLPNDTTIDYIKRVMALPGDTIQVRNGRVYLNDEALKYEKTEDFFFQESANKASTVSRYLETLPNGKIHVILDSNSYGNVDNTPVYTVPEGHVFMMGDNRDNSIDSRYQDDVGFVPVENILGRADLILFGIDMASNTPSWQFWNWFRGEHFFKAIE